MPFLYELHLLIGVNPLWSRRLFAFQSGRFVVWSVGLSVIIIFKGVKFQLHAPIGALVNLFYCLLMHEVF